MSYDTKVIRKNEYKTSTWSGGTTTQLYIYPEDAIYKDLNFKWRLSSAKVEVEESIFTSLPDINRKIMIIDGTLLLEHEGQYNKELNEFDIDSFSGNWTTKSYGKVTDFNLMTNKECTGDLEYIKVDKDSHKEIKLKNNNKEYSTVADIIYCVSGNVMINMENTTNLRKGDLILISRNIDESEKILEIFNEDLSSAHIIRSIIQY